MTLRFTDDVRVNVTEQQLSLVEIDHNLSCGPCNFVEPQLGFGGFESEAYGEELTILPSGDAVPTGNSLESSTWFEYTTEDTGYPVAMTGGGEQLFYRFFGVVGVEQLPCDLAPLESTQLNVRVLRMFGEPLQPIRVMVELPTRMQEVDRFRFKRFKIPTLLTTDGTTTPVAELLNAFKIRSASTLNLVLGQQFCTVPQNLNIVVGDDITLWNPAGELAATVTGYNAATGLLVFDTASVRGEGTFSEWELSGSGLAYDEELYAVRVSPTPTDPTSWFRSTFEVYSFRRAREQGFTGTYSAWLETISSTKHRFRSNSVGRLTTTQSFDIGGWTTIRELRAGDDNRLTLHIAAAPWKLRTGDVLKVNLTKVQFQSRLQWFLDLVNQGVEVEEVPPLNDSEHKTPKYLLKYVGGDYVTTADLPPEFYAAVFNSSSCGLPVCCSGYEEFIFEDVEYEHCTDAVPVVPPIPSTELLGLAFCPTRALDGSAICAEPIADQTIISICRDGFEAYQYEQNGFDGGTSDCTIPTSEICNSLHPYGTPPQLKFPGFESFVLNGNPHEYYEQPCDAQNVYANTPKSCSSQNHYIRSRTALPMAGNSIVFLPMDPYEIALASGFTGTQQEWLDSVGLPAMPTHVNAVVPGIPTYPDQGLVGMVTSTVSAAVATTASIDLNATSPIMIDGVEVSIVDTVLVKDQTDPHENGLYRIDMSTYKLKRHARYGASLQDLVVHVAGGDTNTNTVWRPVVQQPFIFDPTNSVVGSTIGYERMDGFQQYPVTILVAGVIHNPHWNWTSLGRLVYATAMGELVEGDVITGAPPVGLQNFIVAGTIISPTEIDFNPNPTHYLTGYELLTAETVGYYDGLEYSQYITRRAPRSAMYVHRGMEYIAPTTISSRIRHSLVIQDQTTGVDELVMAKYW